VLGKQYGLPFLPQLVTEAHKLIETHAAKNGVAGLEVGWQTMGGPGALNDALLGGQIQFVTVAAPSLATLWDARVERELTLRRLSPKGQRWGGGYDIFRFYSANGVCSTATARKSRCRYSPKPSQGSPRICRRRCSVQTIVCH
jgi:hypothetical protein